MYTGELIIVGDEVIDGRVVDANAHFLSGRLAALGLPVKRITAVGDDENAVAEALTQALERADYLIVTGGLGPTDDDLTAEIAARVFNRPLYRNPDIYALVEASSKARGRPVERIEKMAWAPGGSTPLKPESHFCGFHFEEKGKPLIFLPGVPREVEELFEARVGPLLTQRFTDAGSFCQATLKFYGLWESQLANRIKGIPERHPEVSFGYYPVFPEVHLSLTAKDCAGPDKRLTEAEAEVMAAIGPFYYGRDHDTLETMLGQVLIEKKLTVATAESCTGGRIARRITSTPGASAYFIEGVVTYANEAKERLLGVPTQTLIDHGAVSPETAAAMALGLRERSGVDLAVSVTGVAGPTGGTELKPVGTVYFGLSVKGKLVTEKAFFRGDRDRVQQQAAAKALAMLRREALAWPSDRG